MGKPEAMNKKIMLRTTGYYWQDFAIRNGTTRPIQTNQG